MSPANTKQTYKNNKKQKHTCNYKRKNKKKEKNTTNYKLKLTAASIPTPLIDRCIIPARREHFF